METSRDRTSTPYVRSDSRSQGVPSPCSSWRSPVRTRDRRRPSVLGIGGSRGAASFESRRLQSVHPASRPARWASDDRELGQVLAGNDICIC
jgi:hypothetical protein